MDCLCTPELPLRASRGPSVLRGSIASSTAAAARAAESSPRAQAAEKNDNVLEVSDVAGLSAIEYRNVAQQPRQQQQHVCCLAAQDYQQWQDPANCCYIESGEISISHCNQNEINAP